jgi:hypothetical protein
MLKSSLCKALLSKRTLKTGKTQTRPNIAFSNNKRYDFV